MSVEISLAESVGEDSQAVGYLVFEGLEPVASAFTIDETLAKHRAFSGKPGESIVEPGPSGLNVVVGLGPKEKFTARELRRAAATFARAVAPCETASLDLSALPDGITPARAVQVATEGISGATYQYSRYRSTPNPDALSSVALVLGPAVNDATEGLGRGLAIAGAVTLARDLINTPAADMTPSRLADAARDVAGVSGLRISVLDESDIAAERLGGLLGVARGSDEPPRLIKLTYVPDGYTEDCDIPTVVLVGKGITFDSGGLSLKSGEGMMTMKDDMSGAASVIATLGACRGAGVKIRVIGFAPCTENMPSGRATKPGDILTTRNGKTIEVLNTDAEGRLVLADGLALGVEEEPDAIVDIATLTGACVVALGSDVAGVMGNDSRLISAIEEAASTAGEPVWHLPLPQAYRRFYESPVADMKNIGRPSNAGALVAGLILEEFVGDRPWAHLDIAGPAFTDDDKSGQKKGSTGFGVRTLIELVSSWEALGSPADLAADGSVR